MTKKPGPVQQDTLEMTEDSDNCVVIVICELCNKGITKIALVLSLQYKN